jgi:heptosyltransferase-3
VVEIGLDQVIKTKSNRYLNYCSKFNLKQNSYIIKESLMYIGIDSGFAHFANAYKKESVIMIGQYRQFKRYLPFSGYFESFQDENLLYYDGELHNMPVRLSLEFTKNKLNRIIAD